ncbi:putative bifunctional diguanylate cyclase/phosphodiesterase [Xanthobacter oligotrophicus]|uniref:putative bifunctional diguanylate cyclase/phosphodiesterase n=1 Tax=Xanthobacter oligotrophicus TaxID=2607286 RepID=UPI0011F2FCD8|nr:EAL domain-containing protein [Xanthobacter oligotrophicus]MCG5235165.1 EAL domain-containing protein [Xanthobacter oligotrophicus]
MRGTSRHNGRPEPSASANDLRLTAIGGEFADPALEAAFRESRLGEARRQARILFAASVILNALFLLSDWRFAGTAHFAVAVSARFVVIGLSLLCLGAIHLANTPRRADLIYAIWQWGTASAVAVLVTSQSQLALLVVMLLPTIFYLAVPISFSWLLAGGVGSSLLLFYGYADMSIGWQVGFGLALAVASLNIALMIVVSRTNRMERQFWAAAGEAQSANERLRVSEDTLEKTFQAVPLPLVVARLDDGRHVKSNAAARRFYGGSLDALTGGLCDGCLAPDAAGDFMGRLRSEGAVTGFETTVSVSGGEERRVVLAAAAIPMEPAPHLVAALVDVTERRVAEDQALYAATHDALTGLPNRAAFQDRLGAALEARRPGQGICLLLIDLDGLKDVNDTLGHDAGDAALMETAHRLDALLEPDGLLARLGGDEFVAVVKGAAPVAAGQRLAHAILAELRRPVLHAGRHFATRASIGLAACPDHDCSYGELMKDADLALYAAKQQGRNRTVVYAPAMRQAVLERVALNRAMRAALAEDEIIPYYQPKVSLVTGRIEGLEALVRWRRSPHSVLSPGSFEAALTDPELAVLIGERMVRRVSTDVRGWIEAGHPCGRIAINLAPAQFAGGDLAATLLRQFHAAGVEPTHFDVEITETVFLGRSSDHVAPILDELYRAGVRIALDDFGTGYAGLIHLKQLPIDTIKIDQSFVKDIERDAFDTAIVCAVIDLGRNLGMRVVAEGLETAGQARFLKDKRCELAQGFFFFRPLDGAEMTELLRNEGEEAAAARLATFETS